MLPVASLGIDHRDWSVLLGGRGAFRVPRARVCPSVNKQLARLLIRSAPGQGMPVYTARKCAFQTGVLLSICFSFPVCVCVYLFILKAPCSKKKTKLTIATIKEYINMDFQSA